MDSQVFKSSSLRLHRGICRQVVATVAVSCLLSFVQPASGQNTPMLTEESTVSVITILPGTPLYSAFGHTAIRIRDDSAGIDVGYNFGTFDFDDKGFYLKFLRGKMDYVLARNRFSDVLYAYEQEKRPVIEQTLSFSLAQRQDLFERLELNNLPENRSYRYKFLYDNCSTRPRNVIEAVWGYQLDASATDTESSFRELIAGYLANKPWTRFGIDLLLGSRADVHASGRDRMFLPEEFLHGLDATSSPDGKRLVAAPDTLHWPQGYAGVDPPLPWPGIVGWLLLITSILITIAVEKNPIFKRVALRYDGLLFVVVGIIGVVSALLWFFTEHTVTKANWNLLWALPTHLPLGWLIIRNKQSLLRKILLTLAAASSGLTLIFWSFIPQDLNIWLVPILASIMVRSILLLRDDYIM